MKPRLFGISARMNRRTALIQTVGAAFAGFVSVNNAHAVEGTPGPLRREKFVVYGTVDGEDLVLDVARPPDRTDPRPAVILIHGGGLVDSGADRFELSDAAVALAEAGYVTFNIDYRLSSGDGKNAWPAQLDDAQRAVRWVRANADNYGVDPKRIGAFGWSSGGQLAAFLGTRETRDNSEATLKDFSSKVTCVVSMAGLFDLTIPYQLYDSAPIDAQVMTGVVDGVPTAEQIRDFSPITFVDEQSSPFLILQEGNEEVIPFEHSRRMVSALQDARVQVSYTWIPTYGHLSWGDWGAERPETLAFFERHLRPLI